uniref:Uncharacterized mitochondrial protein AtMg00810-like n=1 Tax=Nicotiana tabacum TaxID=4097 RepID=A0A1S3ZHG0_TOBAC|nr:PREDICTED: uncharacterized mitochondrial protein AtMg00810-like [Nicotiana tabacum]
MNLELQALIDNHTWELVDLLAGKTLIGCKWVFKVKYKADGNVERFKARLVAKGFTQQEGLMDIYNAFLQGDLSEEVYMSLPQGFGSDQELIQEAKTILNGNFKMKDLGELRFFLGIEFARCGLGAAKPTDSPLDQNLKLTSVEYDKHCGGQTTDENLEDRRVYQRLIGRLLYLAIIKPDIYFAVQVLSQFMNAPKQSHYEATLRVIKYVKGSSGHGLLMSSKASGKVTAFSDAD